MIDKLKKFIVHSHNECNPEKISIDDLFLIKQQTTSWLFGDLKYQYMIWVIFDPQRMTYTLYTLKLTQRAMVTHDFFI